MVRVFGFAVAVFMAVSSAHAALLAKYDFVGSAPAAYDATSVDPLVVADPFSPNSGASVSGGMYTGGSNLTTGSINTTQGGFNLYAADPNSGIVIDRIVVRFAPSVQLNTSRAITAKISYGSDGDSGSQTSANAISSSTFTDLDLSDLDRAFPTFNDYGPIAFTLSGALTGNQTGVKLKVDYIEVYGSVVPEPTSMAIFSAIGLVAVARRSRKKNA
jgi:hypothetical protein